MSPFIPEGTVVNTQFDHTSIIKTVINTLGVRDGNGQPAALLAREMAANDLGGGLTRLSPRTDTVTPALTGRPPFDAEIERPLADFHADRVAAAAALLERYGVPLPYNWTELVTTEQATQELDGRIEALRAPNTESAPPPP